jgi:hypothetical protein
MSFHPYGRCTCQGEGRCRWCRTGFDPETAFDRDLASFEEKRKKVRARRRELGLCDFFQPVRVFSDEAREELVGYRCKRCGTLYEDIHEGTAEHFIDPVS